ncbi:MAG: SPFH domain-containing protein [Ardenticatenaceae bacterium]|nr:SPFH domain-containing protein [Anaerolineales bacterium]MCB8941707.1 SPFH domain-containing protein [Ardenticatenaceae bacterium]MCB8972818.1 SPFH domain-containing protein [Ardenticatenaceae bacterium]
MAKVFDRVAIDSWLRDEVVRKFPPGGLGDIKLGSPLIVNPGETAVFVRSGEAMGTFEPGTHVLTTANVPFLMDWVEKGLFGGKNVFTADVYFVKTTDLTMKWGTTQPIIIEHLNRPPGASAIVGNGTYVVRVKEPWRFLNAMDAFRESVRQPQLKDRLDPKLAIMMQDKMSELAIAKNLGPAQLQSFSQDLNELLIGLLQAEFDALGMVLVDFNIRMGLHPKSLEVVTNMGYGTSYTQKQQADAFVAAANNPSGGSMGEIGFGAMGMAAMQNLQNQQQQQPQQVQQPQAAPASGASAGTPDVMTPQQAAEILQVSYEDVLAAIEAGDLKARKIGNAYRISKANLDEFLAG